MKKGKSNDHLDKNRQSAKFTIDELRSYAGNEKLSDEELESQADTLYQLSLILYDIYRNDQSSRPGSDARSKHDNVPGN